MTHVLRNHVDKSKVPHVCSLCDYKCESQSRLKGHRNWYRPHKRALKRVAANGKRINEDKMEYHSSHPVNVSELIEKIENGKSGF